MKNKFKIVLLVVMISLIFWPLQLIAQPLEKTLEIEKPLTSKDYILKYSVQYNTDPTVLLKVAKCESQLGEELQGDYKNGTYLATGLFMYHQETWQRHSELLGEKLDINSNQDQAKLAAFIFANYPEARREWSTYRAIINGGTYSFYSKLLGKHFTVICK